MKKFRYRLETLRRLRALEEERRAEELAVGQRRLAEARAALTSAREEWLVAMRRTAADLVGELDVARARMRQAHLEDLAGEMARRQTKTQEREKALEAILARYHAAVRDRKIMDRMKELKHQEHKAELGRLEAAFFDRVAAARREA